MIRHIFFELPGVLADPKQLRAGYPAGIGAVMSSRYGGTADQWAEAYTQVRADWDYYWSDLDLTGDEPLADLWEGMFRTTRAPFRLARVVEPTKDDLIPFSRALPGLVYERLDALYPHARTLLEKLYAEEVGLHIATHWTVAAARGLLLGSGVLAYFSQPIFGMDVTGAFEKDYTYLALKVGVSPDCCLVVDGDPTALGRAGDAGMRTALVERGSGLSDLLRIVLKPQEIFP